VASSNLTPSPSNTIARSLLETWPSASTTALIPILISYWERPTVAERSMWSSQLASNLETRHSTSALGLTSSSHHSLPLTTTTQRISISSIRLRLHLKTTLWMLLTILSRWPGTPHRMRTTRLLLLGSKKPTAQESIKQSSIISILLKAPTILSSHFNSTWAHTTSD